MALVEEEKAELQKILAKLEMALKEPDGQKRLSKAIFVMITQPTKTNGGS